MSFPFYNWLKFGVKITSRCFVISFSKLRTKRSCDEKKNVARYRAYALPSQNKFPLINFPFITLTPFYFQHSQKQRSKNTNNLEQKRGAEIIPTRNNKEENKKEENLKNVGSRGRPIIYKKLELVSFLLTTFYYCQKSRGSSSI